MPGAGCIDDGVSVDDFGPLPVLVADFEWRFLAALALQFVESGAADAGDAAARLNVLGEGGLAGQRFEVALDQFCAGWVLLWVGRIPSRRRQQPLGGPIDVVFPRREQLNVT